MSREFPPLVQRPARFGHRYAFEDPNDFPTEAWTSPLLGIHMAQTYGEQHSAISDAILRVAASGKGFRTMKRSRMRTTDLDIEARFGLKYGIEKSKLIYLQAGRLTVEYPSPGDLRLDPAFVILEGTNSEHEDIHEVVRDPNTPLSEEGISLNLITSGVLISALHNRNPGFDLLHKFYDELADSNL